MIRPMHQTIRDENDTEAEPVKVLRGFTTATVFDTLSRDSDGRTAARPELVRECRAASHAVMVR